LEICFPLPTRDFDPTETAIPWRTLVDAGHRILFATPDGQPAQADERVLTGRGFAIWQPFLRAGAHAQEVYREMAASPAFQRPISYAELDLRSPDGLVLTGGHAPEMKAYLEAEPVQRLVLRMMRARRPVGALCHGVLVLARTRDPATGRSVLHGRKVTSLNRVQELLAWGMTGLWLGSYYRTYPETVEAEVRLVLASPNDYLSGPFSVLREGPRKLGVGFVVRDGNLLTARFYGDAYRFGQAFLSMLEEGPGPGPGPGPGADGEGVGPPPGPA
jgi:putative intracellular protease/amidase